MKLTLKCKRPSHLLIGLAGWNAAGEIQKRFVSRISELDLFEDLKMIHCFENQKTNYLT